MKNGNKLNSILFFIESYGLNANANGHIIELLVDLLSKKHIVDKIFVATTFNSTNELKEQKNGKITIKRFSRSLNKRMDNILKSKKGNIIKLLTISNSKIFQLKIRVLALLWPLYSMLLIFKYLFYFHTLRTENIKVIIATYLHIEEVIAATIIKRISPNIKVIVYTLDALSGRDTPKLFGTNIAKFSISRWESIILNNVDYYCAMESHRKYYEKDNKYNKYKNKLLYFDIPYFTLRKTTEHSIDKSNINIVFTGTCSIYTGSPLYIIDTVSKITGITLHLYGNTSPDIINYINLSNQRNNIIVHGKLSRDDIISIQNSADFLLNIGTDNECMVPCKIFEYISSKRPIISTIKTNNDPSLPYLKKYKNCLIIDERDEIKKSIENIICFISSERKEPEISNKDLEQLFINNTPNPFLDFVENILLET